MSTLHVSCVRFARAARWPLPAIFAGLSILSIAVPELALAACDATCQAQSLSEHNRVRTRLNNGLMPGPGGVMQPTANPPLGQLTQNNTIAATAQAWANTCTFGQHSASPSVFRSADTGENIYFTSATATPVDAVAAFEGESVDYIYAVINSPLNAGKTVGHYTQLVWAETTSVGCGRAHCTNPSPLGASWDVLVCQYQAAGNFIGEFPYVAGVVQPKLPGGPLDADGNGVYDALTDGLMIIRYLFGLTGNGLINGALGPGATANTPALALARLNGFRLLYDIDGNGKLDALSDGLMMLRYLFGLNGNALINGAIGSLPVRGTAPLIEAYLLTLKP